MTEQKLIMLADDDADDRELFELAVEKISDDIKCLTFKNGRLLLDHVGKSDSLPPGFIFLDINMPVMSGWQTLKELKESTRLKQIPVVMYSTSINDSDKEIARNYGASMFFTKPDDFSQLQRLLREIVGTQKSKHAEISQSIYLTTFNAKN